MQVLVWRERWPGAGRVSDAATDTILQRRCGLVLIFVAASSSLIKYYEDHFLYNFSCKI